jgi:hypothetical protein
MHGRQTAPGLGGNWWLKSVRAFPKGISHGGHRERGTERTERSSSLCPP